jgi:hypothetical protein
LPATAPIDTSALLDSDVLFFDSANPGHRGGDMLACLVPLSARNLAGAIYKALTRRSIGRRPS